MVPNEYALVKLHGNCTKADKLVAKFYLPTPAGIIKSIDGFVEFPYLLSHSFFRGKDINLSVDGVALKKGCSYIKSVQLPFHGSNNRDCYYDAFTRACWTVTTYI